MNTDEIIRKLEQLDTFSSELDIPESERMEMLNQVADYTNTFINGLAGIKGFSEKEIGNLAIRNEKSSLPELLHL